ncbi:MAG: peptide chain release factor N(5)-glutamine methyltransferase [Gammaproteobacteria bacterium]
MSRETPALAATIRSLLVEAQGELKGETLEAELLLAHALETDRSHLRAWPDRLVGPHQSGRFRELVRRRRQGEPVAYILGHREFWSLDLGVTRDTLIPRPETETLVELALERIPPDAAWTIGDLGTGSGAVALAIARERPHCRVVATEYSENALAVARENAIRHGIANVEFRQGDWWRPLAAERLNLALSNPPYVPEDDPHLLQGDLPWEPRQALVAGPDGLEAIRCILAGARRHLEREGWLLLEHGYDQGKAVRGLFREVGLGAIETRPDLAGRDRVTLGRMP